MFRTILLMTTTCSWSRRPSKLLCPRDWNLSWAKVFLFVLEAPQVRRCIGSFCAKGRLWTLRRSTRFPLSSG
jgi:hypothetical protein